MLMKLHYFVRVAHKAIGELRDMYKAILMHTYIYKRAEVGDIRHNSGQFHTFNKVIRRLHTRVELERFSLSAWVATWFFQFGHNVAQGR